MHIMEEKNATNKLAIKEIEELTALIDSALETD
jgi:hypothetical protein